MKNLEPKPPHEMFIPREFHISQSEVDSKRLGVWCNVTIKEGTKFGPFVGRKTTEYKEEMDPIYVWEVIDEASGKFVHFIDATNPTKANWMRYINCARYFEEQNMVSQQEGTDIFYKTIKDVPPGQELLTWYETKFSKKRGRKKGTNKGSNKAAKRKPRSRSNSNESHQSASSSSVSSDNKLTEQAPNRSSLQPSEETIVKVDQVIETVETPETTEYIVQMEEHGTVKASVSEEKSACSKPKEENSAIPTFQFDISKHHVMKNRMGKSVYRCDICSGIYRHAFSLKRHFLRNHINYKYLSKSDVLNCNISSQEVERVVKMCDSMLQKRDNDEATPNKDNLVNGEDCSKDNCKAEKDTTDKKEEESSTQDSGENSEKITNTETSMEVLNSEQKVEQVQSDVIETNVGEITTNVQETKSNVEETADTKMEVDQSPEEITMEDKPESESQNGDLDTKEKSESDDKEDDKLSSNSSESLETVKPRAMLLLASVDKDSEPTDSDYRATPDVEKCLEEEDDMPNGESAATLNEKTQQVSLMPGLFRCNICNELFDVLLKLKVHVQAHLTRGEGKGKFTCETCKEEFNDKKHFVRHLSTHSGSNQVFPCKQCKRKLPSITLLKKHEKLHNTNRHHCQLCQSSFAFLSDLKKHVRKQHPRNFFSCQYCVKFFTNRGLLEEHAKTHAELEQLQKTMPIFDTPDMDSDRAESMRLAKYKSGQFKFACTVCKKRFHDYSTMCRHRRLAHQRQLLFRQKAAKANSPVLEATEFKYDLALLDIDPQDFFFSNVARNISENLNNYIVGRPEHLCRERTEVASGGDSEEEFLHQYNFPKGTKMEKCLQQVTQDQKSKLMSTIPKPALNVPTAQVTIQPSSQPPQLSIVSEQSAFTPVTSSVTSSRSSLPVTQADDPIPFQKGNVAQIYQCAFCRKLFKNFLVYQEHMFNKHRKTILKENRPRYIRDDLLNRLVSRIPSPPPEPITPTETPLDLTGATKPKVPLPPRPPIMDLTSPRLPQPPVPVVNMNQAAQQALKSCQHGHVHKLVKDYLKQCGHSLPNKLPSDPKLLRRLLVSGTDSVQRKLVCTICDWEFKDKASLKIHQERIHPNVMCKHVEIEPQICTKWAYAPTPVGLLDVCSAPVSIEHMTSQDLTYDCTKCNKSFESSSSLHTHILQCVSKVSPTKPRHHKHSTPAYVGRIKFKSGNDHNAENKIRVSNAILKKVKKQQKSHDVTPMAAKKRRSFDLQYNPNNHIRRREMTQVLDIQRCTGCGEKFSTISKLERHIRSCEQKSAMKELQVMSTCVKPKPDPDDSKRLVCVYCDKKFTYLGSLKKHIVEVCPVRKTIASTRESDLNLNWEEVILSMVHPTQKPNVPSRSTSPANQTAEEELRKRKRSKRKNHGWGNVKKRKQESPTDELEAEDVTESFALEGLFDETAPDSEQPVEDTYEVERQPTDVTEVEKQSTDVTDVQKHPTDEHMEKTAEESNAEESMEVTDVSEKQTKEPAETIVEQSQVPQHINAENEEITEPSDDESPVVIASSDEQPSVIPPNDSQPPELTETIAEQSTDVSEMTHKQPSDVSETTDKQPPDVSETNHTQPPDVSETTNNQPPELTPEQARELIDRQETLPYEMSSPSKADCDVTSPVLLSPCTRLLTPETSPTDPVKRKLLETLKSRASKEPISDDVTTEAPITEEIESEQPINAVVSKVDVKQDSPVSSTPRKIAEVCCGKTQNQEVNEEGRKMGMKDEGMEEEQIVEYKEKKMVGEDINKDELDLEEKKEEQIEETQDAEDEITGMLFISESESEPPTPRKRGPGHVKKTEVTVQPKFNQPEPSDQNTKSLTTSPRNKDTVEDKPAQNSAKKSLEKTKRKRASVSPEAPSKRKQTSDTKNKAASSKQISGLTVETHETEQEEDHTTDNVDKKMNKGAAIKVLSPAKAKNKTTGKEPTGEKKTNKSTPEQNKNDKSPNEKKKTPQEKKLTTPEKKATRGRRSLSVEAQDETDDVSKPKKVALTRRASTRSSVSHESPKTPGRGKADGKTARSKDASPDANKPRRSSSRGKDDIPMTPISRRSKSCDETESKKVTPPSTRNKNKTDTTPKSFTRLKSRGKRSHGDEESVSSQDSGIAQEEGRQTRLSSVSSKVSDTKRKSKEPLPSPPMPRRGQRNKIKTSKCA